jgi:hypothetical protein
MVVFTCKLNAWDTEAGGSQVLGQTRLHRQTPSQTNPPTPGNSCDNPRLECKLNEF